MDPLSIVASTLGIIQAIASTYKAIQHLRGLPNEFKEVNRKLPLAKDTLSLARDHLQGLTLDDTSKEAIRSVVGDCEEKAKKLQGIFEKVEGGMENAKDGSVLDFYRSSLLRLGKAHRVETLMQGILRGLDALATNQLFKTATQDQVSQLKDAIDQLSNVKSSVPDSDFEGCATQNIASGGTGHQSVIHGQDHKINSGSGKQFNAHSMTFAQSNDGYKTRNDILQTLYTSPYLERKNRNLNRVPGTCEWLIGHDDFQRWRESKSSSMLWVSANPGCGKSVLAKYLVDSELQTTNTRTSCYFFFKDDFKDQRSATSALSCILHQLFTQREDLFSDKTVRRFEAYKTHLTTSFDDLWEVLIMTSQGNNAGELVCILDAFDECVDQERDKLSRALRNFYDPENDTKNNVNLKFLVTGRPYDKIGRAFQPLDIPGLSIIHLKGEGAVEILRIAQEIDIYIEHRVSCIRASLDLTPDEEELLLEKLREIPHQTYLWVYLTLELLESDISINKTRIREATSSLPRTVDDAYERILAKSSNSEEAKKLLHIVVAAARPLTLAEMDLALALGQGHRSYKDLDFRPEVRFGRYVRDLCGLFVTITDSKIYLLHQTAKEFLVPKDNAQLLSPHDNLRRWKSSLNPSESHRIISQICIRHLLFTEFETHPLDENLGGGVFQYCREHIFLDYSAIYWAAHFQASGTEDSVAIESLRRICDARSRGCLTWFRICWVSIHETFPEEFTTLMIASYFGLAQIVKLELEKKDVEVDSRDGFYERSALSWASGNGFDGVVKLLIEGPKKRFRLRFLKGAKVDERDINGRTPLSHAAGYGHEATVKLLLDKGADVNFKDVFGRRPLSWVAEKGHDAIVKLLLENGADVNFKDTLDQRPLLIAAKFGHEAIVKLLLKKGADVNFKDSIGRTPLSWVAEKGHDAIVKLLLENGADVNFKDTLDQSPLLLAATYGHEAIVKLLLDKGADVNFKDALDQRPLLLAARYGHEAIVKLLLDKGADVNFKDALDQTPLFFAARFGHGAIVKLLLEKGADFNSEDWFSETPLLLAAKNGHEAIVKLLLEKGADVNFKDNYGHTALSWAIENRHETIVKLLHRKSR